MYSSQYSTVVSTRHRSTLFSLHERQNTKVCSKTTKHGDGIGAEELAFLARELPKFYSINGRQSNASHGTVLEQTSMKRQRSETANSFYYPTRNYFATSNNKRATIFSRLCTQGKYCPIHKHKSLLITQNHRGSRISFRHLANKRSVAYLFGIYLQPYIISALALQRIKEVVIKTGINYSTRAAKLNRVTQNPAEYLKSSKTR